MVGVGSQVEGVLHTSCDELLKVRSLLIKLEMLLLFLLVGSVQVLALSTPASGETDTVGKFSSDDYQDFVETAVRVLAKGDERGLRKILSPSMIQRSESELGRAKVDLMIRQQFLGFFEDFHHLSANVHSTKTFDVAKRPGLAIFRSFLNEVGEEKPFVMYVIEENEELVLGNVLINKTLRDVSNIAQSRKLPSP